MTDVLTRPKASARLHLSYARGPVFYDPIRSINAAKVDWTFTGTATSEEAEMSGNYVLHLPTPPSGESSVSRLIRGLTPGRSYTLAATVGISNPAVWGTGVGYVRAGVDGIGSRLWTRAELNAAAPVFPYIVNLYTFTATDTAHRVTFTLEHEPGATPFANIDNVYLYREPFEDDVDVEATDAEITLDASQVVYGSGTVRLKLDPTTADQIDPRTPTRALITLSTQLDESDARSFDLGMRVRAIDHAEREVTLDLATDEALLLDYAQLVADTGARASQSSVRSVCNYVLGKIGASLAPGSTDANVTALTEATNLIRNPRVANDTTGWYTTYTTGSAPGARIASGGPAGCPTYFYFGGASASGVYLWLHENELPVQTNTVYMLSCYARSAQGVTVALQPWLMDASGTTVAVSPLEPVQLTSAWQRIKIKVTAINGATKMRVRLAVVGNLNSGQYVDVTGFRLSTLTGDDADDYAYFDGSSANTADYTYVWPAGVAAHAGVSTRRPARPAPTPDAFVWRPGVPAWDFLETLLASAGLRLYCDEHRVWRLIDTEYELPATVTVTPDNAATGQDVITREDTRTFAEGCVVNWRWRDGGDTDREYTETFGAPGRVHVIDMNAPYPGNGLAEAVVTRRRGQGRVQEVTAAPDLATEPFGFVNISMPALPPTVEQVRSVTWSLNDATMRVTTRQKEDTP